MPKSQPLSSRLAGVERQFGEWRRTRTKPYTPRELKEQVVALLAEHSRRQICRVLGISYEMLRRWEEELDTVSSGAFVTLPSVPAPPSASAPAPSAPATSSPGVLTLTRHSAEGGAVSIAGEMDQGQCRWALQLLAETSV